MTRARILPFAAMAFFGCGTGDTVQIASVHVKTQLIVAAQGGTIDVTAAEHTRLGGTRLAIPAGALAADTRITVGIIDESLVDDEADMSGPAVELGPDGTQFSSPISLTIPYEGVQDEDLVRVFVVQSDGTRTVVLPDAITFDAAAGTVTFAVSHFTRFQGGRSRRPCSHVRCPNGSCRRGRCIPPPACSDPAECGPRPGIATEMCADGSIGGFTGRCLPTAAPTMNGNACGWEILSCPPPNPTRCMSDRECNGGACVNGVCSSNPAQCGAMECGPPPLAPNIMCPDGMTIGGPTACFRHADGSCGYDFINCPGNPNACMIDRECSAGESCVNGVCSNNNPTSCTATMQCPRGLNCDPASGQCVPPTPACMSDRECGANASCVNGQCTPSGPTMCGPNTQCPMGEVCDAMIGLCVPVVTGCQIDSDCGRGEACLNGQCARVECNSNIPCPMGEVCGPTGRCTPPNPPQCGPMNACPPNAVCDVNGQCIPVTSPCMSDRECGMGQACINGQCGPQAGACSAMECGPAPGLPNYLCPDGRTVAGPTACYRHPDQSCGYDIISCPTTMCATDRDCANAAGMQSVCVNGVCQ